MFQEPALLPWRTLLENIVARARFERALQPLDDIGLTDRAATYPGQLSLSQQRRLALARAFAVRPDLLLLDEPFVSLNPELVESMMEISVRLRAAHRGAAVLVTHVRAEAEKLADRIVTLGGTPGRITAEVQNSGAYFHSSASGVTSAGS